MEVLATHKPFLTPRITDLIASNLDRKGDPSEIPAERLTSREREIVQLLSEGKSSKEVASLLGISAKTVETHRSNLMRKLGVHSVADLVRYAVRNQIVEP